MTCRPLQMLGFALAFLFVGLLPSRAAAQSFGGRVGVSADPDQFYFGAHYETKPVIEHVTFRPNIEIGFGDDVTLTTLNFEFAYKFPTRGVWGVYAGGGPALNLAHADSHTDAGGGLNILLGVAHRKGLFFEIKVGMIDSPSFKFGVGYVFK